MIVMSFQDGKLSTFSGRVQQWKSALHGLPVTLRIVRGKSDKSGPGLNLLCSQIHSKPEWTWPEVAILGADQKERSLWGQE